MENENKCSSSPFSSKTLGNQDLWIERPEFEIEFDTIISNNQKVFKELEKLGIKFEQVRRYCG